MKVRWVFKSASEQQAFIDSTRNAEVETPDGMEVTLFSEITDKGQYAVTLWCDSEDEPEWDSSGK